VKKLVVGRRFGIEKTKEQQHETKEEQQEAFAKLGDKMMDVSATSKASPVRSATCSGLAVAWVLF